MKLFIIPFFYNADIVCNTGPFPILSNISGQVEQWMEPSLGTGKG
jgi:hypothetical protein